MGMRKAQTPKPYARPITWISAALRVLFVILVRQLLGSQFCVIVTV